MDSLPTGLSGKPKDKILRQLKINLYPSSFWRGAVCRGELCHQNWGDGRPEAEDRLRGKTPSLLFLSSWGTPAGPGWPQGGSCSAGFSEGVKGLGPECWLRAGNPKLLCGGACQPAIFCRTGGSLRVPPPHPFSPEVAQSKHLLNLLPHSGPLLCQDTAWFLGVGTSWRPSFLISRSTG